LPSPIHQLSKLAQLGADTLDHNHSGDESVSETPCWVTLHLVRTYTMGHAYVCLTLLSTIHQLSKLAQLGADGQDHNHSGDKSVSETLCGNTLHLIQTYTMKRAHVCPTLPSTIRQPSKPAQLGADSPDHNHSADKSVSETPCWVTLHLIRTYTMGHAHVCLTLLSTIYQLSKLAQLGADSLDHNHSSDKSVSETPCWVTPHLIRTYAMGHAYV
jgi:hypothetical protein